MYNFNTAWFTGCSLRALEDMATSPRESAKSTNLFTVTTHIVCLFYACYKNNVHQVWNLKFAFLWLDPFSVSTCFMCSGMEVASWGSVCCEFCKRKSYYTFIIAYSIHATVSTYVAVCMILWWVCNGECVININLLQIKCACDVLVDTYYLQCSCTLS